MEEDIQLNVQAQYESLNGLLAKLEETKKALGNMSKARINFDIKKDIQKSADPIMKASEYLTEALKKVNKAKNDLVKAMVSGDTKNIEKAKAEIQRSQQFARDVAKTIEHTKAFNESKQNVTNEFSELQKQNQELQEYENRVKMAREALAKFELSLDPTKQKLSELKQKLEEAKNQFVKLKVAQQDTSSAEKSIKKLTNQIKETEQSTKKTANQWKVLLNRIKNISIYRTIRRALQLVFQTITQGFERVTLLNRDASNLANRLRADYNLIATAIGSIVYTILNGLSGSIDSATDSLLNLLNSLNKVLALAFGSDKYFKVVRKGIDGINKSTQKLSFDKFESLSKKDENLLGVDLEKVKLADDELLKLTNTEENLYNLVTSLKDALINIAGILGVVWRDIVKPLIDSGVVNFLVSLISALITILDKLGLLRVAVLLLIGTKIVSFISTAIKAVKALSASFKTTLLVVMAFLAGFYIVDSILSGFSGVAKLVVSSIMAVVSACVALWAVLWAIKNAWNWVALAGVAVAGGVFIASIKGIVDGANDISVGEFEDGGIPNKAELFWMNENGIPEALINTGGTQTNVINIDQLSEGMRRGAVQAIYDTGIVDAIRSGGNTQLVVDKDVLGRTVAQSSGFRNEVNRRNTSLNLR